MIERGLQRGAAMFGCLAEALAMNGWPDEGNDKVHAQIWGAATAIPSRQGTRIRVLQPATWEARTRSGSGGVTNNGVQTV